MSLWPSHGQFGNGVDDPVEVLLADRVDIRVGRGIHEVDGVGDAVFAGKLDGVQVVTQRAAQCEASRSTRSSSWDRPAADSLHVALVEGARDRSA